ncbi:tail tape measure protein [Polymorphobacter sp. PAMC 29334]|uniref:tail tape measure protein n=1 Tax=Polymorphobacter sp. PAMC 29334 TaxID=2862331 RepID=UPI001C79941F|nr:tail tape measure protein [Polymorphobacter sp. PAMC 29334]QYE33700.1 tail tape measure protein [Polymorphobacter sp. PAMC 29334]
MDQQLDSLVIGIRADTSGFARDVADIKGQLDGPLASGADHAGKAIESALARAVKTGSLGFDDLRKVALSTLAEIAASAIKTDLTGLFGGSSSGGGGILSSLASAAGSLFGGAPGRATGGPVTGGSAYLVGERGPELFVPTTAGRIGTGGGQGGPVSITVNVAAPRDAAPAMMQRTGAQVARAVRQALDRADG